MGRSKDLLEALKIDELVDFENETTQTIMDKMLKRVDNLPPAKKVVFWQKMAEQVTAMFLDQTPSGDVRFNKFIKKFYRDIFKSLQGE